MTFIEDLEGGKLSKQVFLIWIPQFCPKLSASSVSFTCENKVDYVSGRGLWSVLTVVAAMTARARQGFFVRRQTSVTRQMLDQDFGATILTRKGRVQPSTSVQINMKTTTKKARTFLLSSLASPLSSSLPPFLFSLDFAVWAKWSLRECASRVSRLKNKRESLRLFLWNGSSFFLIAK